MKFPLWIIMALIVVSLVFAGVMTYKLFQAQVLAPPPPETIADVVDAVPPPIISPTRVIASPAQPQTPELPVHKYEKAVVKKEPERNTGDAEPAVRLIQKIGSIVISPGEVTAVSVVR